MQHAREVIPKEACALLLPLIDPTDPLTKLPNLLGPFEVIVFDPAMNQEYKRQVHLLVITPDVNFALPTPSITLTLAAVCEMVLECGVRLTTKDVFQGYYDNPLAKFKTSIERSLLRSYLESCSHLWLPHGSRALQRETRHGPSMPVEGSAKAPSSITLSQWPWGPGCA